MSGDIFGAHTGALADSSTRIMNVANDFKNEYEKMFLVVSEWSSPAATAVANKIIEQRPNLDAMYNAICGYAEYCGRAANRIEENEENIVTGVGGNNG